MAIVDELIAVLGYEIQGEENAKKFEKRVDSMSKQLNKFALAASAAASAGAAMLYKFGKNVIQTGSQFETFEAILSTVEGTGEKARASLDWLEDFAVATPYEINELTESFVRLKALGVDPLADEAFRKLGDAAAAMGTPLEAAVGSLTNAMVGRFVRLQQFGIKTEQVGDNLVFRWSEHGKELEKTVENNATAVKSFILDNFGRRFNNAMLEQSKTFDGITGNIADAWLRFKRSVADKGFFDYVKGLTQGLLDKLNELDADGTLDRWAGHISAALVKITSAFVALATQTAAHIEFLSENMGDLSTPLKVLGFYLGWLLIRMFPVTSVLIAIGGALDDLLTYMEGGESIIGNFVEKIKDLTGMSEGAAEAVAALGVAVGAALVVAFIRAPIAALAAMSRVLVAGLAGLAVRLLPLIAMVFTPAGLIAAVAAAAITLVAAYWDEIKAGFASLDLFGAGARLMTSLWNGMKSMGSAIRDWIGNLFNFGAGEQAPSGGRNAPRARRSARQPTNFTDLRSRVDAMNGVGAAQSVAGDKSVDNRNQSQTNNITINQSVAGVSQAPEAAARATGRAVGRSAMSQRSQVEASPAL